MRKLSFLLLFTSFLFSTACEKENDCLNGTVRFTSQSNNPYNLYINDILERRIPGNTFIELNLPEGRHRAKVEQVSGYLLVPTIRETTLNVFGCQDSQWIFP